MTFDEALVIATILSVILVLAGYQIMRQAKPPTMQDVPRETTAEAKKRAWSDAQKELGSHLKRVK